MKFFNSLISNCQFEYSAYLDDVQDIPEPSYPLYSLYSKHHTLLPRSVDPNTVSQVKEILAEVVVMSFPSTSLPDHLCFLKGDIQYAHEHDPCLQLPLVSEHPLHYRFEQLSPYNVFERLPLKHDIDTSLPKQYERLNDLQYANYVCILPYCKSKKFIETKVPAINCRVLTDF